MKWNNEEIKPKKEGWYLCCGDLIEWNMKDGDPPDTYFLCYFSDGWGKEILSGMYDEVKFMFWMELPEFPNNNQPERSKREDLIEQLQHQCKAVLHGNH